MSKQITVKEMIQRLQELPQDATIRVQVSMGNKKYPEHLELEKNDYNMPATLTLSPTMDSVFGGEVTVFASLPFDMEKNVMKTIVERPIKNKTK